MSRLERRLKKANPYASVPSTRDQEKAARKQAKADAKAADRRAGHHASVRAGKPKPRWPW
ncbi:hypothetical protein [Streptomyces sp. DSM 40484]|uniref:hypothetical protein n=1 Tax=Streptomyces kroppenstedtii TaxID=3051181 RepID=UPI0028D8CB7E|nr:hypothetical protein [Streptomyces sp. DSM 40484]